MSKAFGEEIRVKGAGRTDAGVHARGQVATFSMASAIPVKAIPPAVGRHLPRDLRVDDVHEVDADFDARRSATGRHYRYLLLERADVLSERYAWCSRRSWNRDGLVRATGALEGRHDFSAFQSAGSTPVHPVCHVWRATWSRWERGLRFDIVADHFLYRMVRNIVGTAVGLSSEKDPSIRMRRLLAGRDRRKAGKAAPACGLSLEEVFYSGGQS